MPQHPDLVGPPDPIEDEPLEDDAYIWPTGLLGSRTAASYAGKFVGTFIDDENAIAALRARMDAEKFWPNIWSVSDHGNFHIITD